MSTTYFPVRKHQFYSQLQRNQTTHGFPLISAKGEEKKHTETGKSPRKINEYRLFSWNWKDYSLIFPPKSFYEIIYFSFFCFWWDFYFTPNAICEQEQSSHKQTDISSQNRLIYLNFKWFLLPNYHLSLSDGRMNCWLEKDVQTFLEYLMGSSSLLGLCIQVE